MAEIIVHTEKCVGCEDCVFLCPVKVFRMENKKAAAADASSCCGLSCRMCVAYCWQDAIELREDQLA